ncbi:hypothetical protein RHMOL_Rhmol03G0039200 [Rhododendron molle]|uniref:Uncharacterized protein n=1 Tax=Rhododendron molle TaxID=49168 RepID=A0ACC0PCM6_RHOML|nr:hypothetical protein RHMOL_Rhmol03G0039200 [Rhododendron molle]
METEREVHQVTQKATFEKIASLEKEKNDMEDELACITVHEITQEAAKEKVKLKKSKEQCSPRSMFKRVIARDDRKLNYSEDYVYGQVKRKSPQVNPIDVDNSPDYEQQQKGKKKMLKKLKVNTEIDTIDVDESQEYEQQEKRKKKKLKNLKVGAQVAKLICPETWKKIEQLWKTREPDTVVMKSAQDVIYVDLLDIENLLFEDPISNQRVTVAGYINADKKQAAKMVMSDKAEVQMDSPQQTPGSVDCGIVIMSIMRKYIENENPTSAITRQDWLHSTHQVWDSLSNRYNSLSRSHVQDLKGKLYSITKTSTIEHYVDTLKEFSQKLIVAGSPVDEDDLIFHTLRGLPPVFNGFKTTVRAMRTRGDIISFDQVVNMLNGEDQLLQQSSAEHASSSSSVLVATHGSPSPQGPISASTSSMPASLLNTSSVSSGIPQSVGQYVSPQLGSTSYYGSVPPSVQFSRQSVLGPHPSHPYGESSPSHLLEPEVLERPTTFDDDESQYRSTIALLYALLWEQVYLVPVKDVVWTDDESCILTMRVNNLSKSLSQQNFEKSRPSTSVSKPNQNFKPKSRNNKRHDVILTPFRLQVLNTYTIPRLRHSAAYAIFGHGRFGWVVAQSVTTEAQGCTLSKEDSPMSTPHETSSSSPSPPSSPKPVKTEVIVMAEAPNLATILADIQRNMAAMQRRADQTDASMTDLRTLIEERLPLVAARRRRKAKSGS